MGLSFMGFERLVLMSRSGQRVNCKWSIYVGLCRYHGHQLLVCSFSVSLAEHRVRGMEGNFSQVCHRIATVTLGFHRIHP